MATALTIPLDDWVCATARPARTDAVYDSCAPGTRRDHSKVTVEDAFPLLIQACRTRFGGLQALDFGIKESSGPLGSNFELSLFNSLKPLV
jgi:hypothetical protein